MCALYVCLICDHAAVFRRTLIIQTNLISINAEKEQKDVAALTRLRTNRFSNQTSQQARVVGRGGRGVHLERERERERKRALLGTKVAM